MITLYVKTGCPFSAKAMAALDAYGVDYEQRNIKSAVFLKELMALGGKKQTPYFVHGDEQFYESDRIVAYVEEHFADIPEEGKPRVHMAKNDALCD
jgi:glutathione S-transferase